MSQGGIPHIFQPFVRSCDRQRISVLGLKVDRCTVRTTRKNLLVDACCSCCFLFCGQDASLCFACSSEGRRRSLESFALSTLSVRSHVSLHADPEQKLRPNSFRSRALFGLFLFERSSVFVAQDTARKSESLKREMALLGERHAAASGGSPGGCCGATRHLSGSRTMYKMDSLYFADVLRQTTIIHVSQVFVA